MKNNENSYAPYSSLNKHKSNLSLPKIEGLTNMNSGNDNVYKNYDKVCVFHPHRISRLKDLRSEFSFAFKDADTVILCPIYSAGEKLKLGFNYMDFAKDIIRNSKVKLFLINDNYHLAKFIKNNMYGKKIVIGMGAGSISNWMRKIPKLI